MASYGKIIFKIHYKLLFRFIKSAYKENTENAVGYTACCLLGIFFFFLYFNTNYGSYGAVITSAAIISLIHYKRKDLFFIQGFTNFRRVLLIEYALICIPFSIYYILSSRSYIPAPLFSVALALVPINRITFRKNKTIERLIALLNFKYYELRCGLRREWLFFLLLILLGIFVPSYFKIAELAIIALLLITIRLSTFHRYCESYMMLSLEASSISKHIKNKLISFVAFSSVLIVLPAAFALIFIHTISPWYILGVVFILICSTCFVLFIKFINFKEGLDTALVSAPYIINASLISLLPIFLPFYLLSLFIQVKRKWAYYYARN